MAEPLTPAGIIKAFKKWDVRFIERQGWASHRRDPGHGSWGPVNGLMLHHTGDDLPDDIDERVLWAGRPDLPGPLATWGQRDDGFAVMLGGGRANHAGKGDAGVMNAVIQESYGKFPPKPVSDSIDGNARFYAQETMYSGGHPMSLKAYRNTVRAFAAICDAHGWSAKSAIGHKEWTRRKIDPGNLSMYKFRKDVQACLDAGPGNWPVKEPVLRPEITAMRLSLKKFLAKKRRKSLKDAALAFDAQLAKVERR